MRYATFDHIINTWLPLQRRSYKKLNNIHNYNNSHWWSTDSIQLHLKTNEDTYMSYSL
jgi:hypothetical protein